jgi:hypothetical protein
MLKSCSSFVSTLLVPGTSTFVMQLYDEGGDRTYLSSLVDALCYLVFGED